MFLFRQGFCGFLSMQGRRWNGLGRSSTAISDSKSKTFSGRVTALTGREAPLLGHRLRALRLREGLTQGQLAERTGFSVSYLSQVERGITVPSIGSLKKICDGLGTPAYEVMFQVENGVADTAPDLTPVTASRPSAVVVRSGKRKAMLLPGSDIRYELLVPDLRRRAAVATFSAPAGATSGEEPFVHSGEEIGIVLKGVLEIEVGGQTYRLQPGDSIFIDSTVPHRWRNGSDSEVEAIWVMTPPSF